MEENTLAKTEIKELNLEQVKPYLERIIHTASKLDQASARHASEGKRFEFAACDLLAKGAGAALILFPLFLAYNRERYIPVEPFLYWFFALGAGIVHKLLWARRLSQASLAEHKARSQMMSDLYDRVLTPDQNFNNVASLWRDILDEENAFFDLIKQKKFSKSQAKRFKYIVPINTSFSWQVCVQFALVLLGALSALRLFSFWEFLTNMPFIFSAGLTALVKLDRLAALFA
ncbi:MAG: hypothetical protein COV74_07555 [Candidatus Omnitrophica bacterium CG11_big_fil_rev_8_21_14_0_20_45_26]|uniref:Uncharacterized protein n=1 Tax=Candidatus Abzuiibacterium crystallinum TaxID=1974748 RepID=A0A2H0LQH1_9BACT|nr:MAG: hypothetical protein COV74_07555 [Candidatus Omnitrophica bacterium CG11_big_fil_rev_8_21_14_0_20_45_26]PIW64140.1 MAG: hypothetical protein COW12_07435 [Candidatus Omnitrophica bacterium CG12_big_fil_rev_8_21_14_0_65_45_16]